MAARRRLDSTLFAPGLLGPVAGADLARLSLPELPGLRRWLGGARRRGGPAGSNEDVLAALFGTSPAKAPVAPVSYRGATGRSPAAPVLRADPVFLRVETDHLLLFDAGALALSRDESDSLVARFNEFFADEGLRLEAPCADEWYLFGVDALEAGTTPLARVRARNVGPFMPSGQAGASLRRLMNEVQMLFFEHPVNKAREAAGQLPVSGVWPWGEGEMPGELAPAWDGVWAQSSYARGLAALSHTAHAQAPVSWTAWQGARAAPGRYLVVLEDALSPAVRGDVAAWLAAVERLDQAWFQSRTGTPTRLLTGDGREFHARRRWSLPWRRRGDIAALLRDGSG